MILSWFDFWSRWEGLKMEGGELRMLFLFLGLVFCVGFVVGIGWRVLGRFNL